MFFEAIITSITNFISPPKLTTTGYLNKPSLERIINFIWQE